MSNVAQSIKAPGLDMSSARVAPVRTIDIRPTDCGFLLVAVTTRPEGGFKETALNPFQPVFDAAQASQMAEAVARAVEHATGIMFGYPGVNGPQKGARKK